VRAGSLAPYRPICSASKRIAHRPHPPGSTPPAVSFCSCRLWPAAETATSSAGEDLNCHQGYHDEYNFGNTLPRAVAKHVPTEIGIYNENDLDVSVARLLAARIRLGELDAERAGQEQVPWVALARERVPRGSWANAAENDALTQAPERRELARTIASESIVLLQNRDTTLPGGTTAKLLPLAVPSTGPYRVAILGYYAARSPLYLGGYSSVQQGVGARHEISGYAGLRAAILALNPAAVVEHLPGLTSEALDEIDAPSVEAAANYDVVVVHHAWRRFAVAGGAPPRAAQQSTRDRVGRPTGGAAHRWRPRCGHDHCRRRIRG